MLYSLRDLNGMSQAMFTETLGEVFEQTPAIATAAWRHRPFASVDDLHQKMVAVIADLDQEAQLALVRAHPELGSHGKMAESSVQEQVSVGLTLLTSNEVVYLRTLNQTYSDKFGFPFVIAVKNHTKASIFSALEQRLHHTANQELQQAMAEIHQIAYFRLTALINSD